MQIGLRLHGVLTNHMQQYTYSANGALRWRNDLTEYLDCVTGFEAPVLLEKFTSLLGLVSLLVVAPESLMALVSGTLRLSHGEALRYVRLREDYGSARVEGRSLQQVFAQDEGSAPSSVPTPR